MVHDNRLSVDTAPLQSKIPETLYAEVKKLSGANGNQILECEDFYHEIDKPILFLGKAARLSALEYLHAWRKKIISALLTLHFTDIYSRWPSITIDELAQTLEGTLIGCPNLDLAVSIIVGDLLRWQSATDDPLLFISIRASLESCRVLYQQWLDTGHEPFLEDNEGKGFFKNVCDNLVADKIHIAELSEAGSIFLSGNYDAQTQTLSIRGTSETEGPDVDFYMTILHESFHAYQFMTGKTGETMVHDEIEAYILQYKFSRLLMNHYSPQIYCASDKNISRPDCKLLMDFLLKEIKYFMPPFQEQAHKTAMHEMHRGSLKQRKRAALEERYAWQMLCQQLILEVMINEGEGKDSRSARDMTSQLFQSDSIQKSDVEGVIRVVAHEYIARFQTGEDAARLYLTTLFKDIMPELVFAYRRIQSPRLMESSITHGNP